MPDEPTTARPPSEAKRAAGAWLHDSQRSAHCADHRRTASILESPKGTPMKKLRTRHHRRRPRALGLRGGMSDTQRNTGIGAGVGALGGAAIGSRTGGNRSAIGTGAAVGAAGRRAAAATCGRSAWKRRRRQMEQATQGTGIAVTQTANNELKLAIPSDVSFDIGRAAIKPELRADPRPVRHRPAQQPERRGAHHRPHRQHRHRRHQQPAVGRTRRQHARLPDRARRAAAAPSASKAGLARADRRQQQRRRPGAEPARRDLRGRTPPQG